MDSGVTGLSETAVSGLGLRECDLGGGRVSGFGLLGRNEDALSSRRVP
jgi:hypothetical protein